MRSELSVIRSLAPLRRWHPWIVPSTVVLGLLAALSEGIGLSLFMPLLYSIDGAFSGGEGGPLGDALAGMFSALPASERLLAISIGIMGLVFVKNLLLYLNEVLKSWIRTLMVHSLRSRVADQLLDGDIEWVEKNDSGRLLNALQNQTQEVGGAFASHVDLLVRAGTALVFGGFLLLVSWKLTLGVGAALLVASVLIRLVWRRVEVGSGRFVRAWDTLSQRSLELLSGMRTIRVFDRVDYERERFAQASHRASRVWFDLDLLSGVVRPASEVLMVGVLVAVLLTTLENAANLPTILTFAFILYRLRPHVQGIDVARAQLLSAKAPVEMVMGMLDPADKRPLPSGKAGFVGLRDAIELEGIAFRYEGTERDVLRDVSIRFPAGKTTAVIGHSGAGKSTLIHLMLRLYDPTRGVVKVDGKPLPQLDLHMWRKRIAVVTQDVMLFNASAAENIAYGRAGAGPADVERAARLAGADAFLRALPQGYDTIVGDRGVRLSGGQKQRIALARALVREPEILILDEATNALDAETESFVQDAVASLRDRVTLIVVSHRLSAVVRADHFVLLDAGKVTAHGDRSILGSLDDALRRLYGAAPVRELAIAGGSR
jgi:subfamily B ATP-binding cassette protein MsbA